MRARQSPVSSELPVEKGSLPAPWIVESFVFVGFAREFLEVRAVCGVFPARPPLGRVVRALRIRICRKRLALFPRGFAFLELIRHRSLPHLWLPPRNLEPLSFRAR